MTGRRNIIDAKVVMAGGLSLNGGTGLISGSAAAPTASFTASGGDLILDNLAGFSASIAGMTNAGEKIDLGGFAYSTGETVSWTQGAGHGTLTVSGGGKVANLTLIGSYSTSNFTLSNDGKGGAYITDPPVGGGGGAQVLAFAQAMAGFGQGSETSIAGGTAVQHQSATMSLASALIPTGSTSGRVPERFGAQACTGLERRHQTARPCTSRVLVADGAVADQAQEAERGRDERPEQGQNAQGHRGDQQQAGDLPRP